MDQQTYNKLKKEVEELRHLPGKQRGEHIKYYVRYVKNNYGEKGLKKVTDTLKEMDFDIGDVESFSDTQWIPETLGHIFFVASARILGWDEKEMFDLGRDLMPISTVNKIFSRYFSTIDKTLRIGVRQWNKNFTRGELRVEDLDKKKRKGKFVLTGFRSHYFAYVHFQGFFSRIIEIITGSDKVKVSSPKNIDEETGHCEWEFQW